MFPQRGNVAAWAQKGGSVCPLWGRRVHFDGDLFPQSGNVAAWARKGGSVCQLWGRRAYFDGDLFPQRRNVPAWARKGGSVCPLWCRRAYFDGDLFPAEVKCCRLPPSECRMSPPGHKKQPPREGRLSEKYFFERGRLFCPGSSRKFPEVPGSSRKSPEGKITPTQLLRLVLETCRSKRGLRLEPLQGFCR